MKTAYLAVGDEIVSGRITDSNLSVLASCAAGFERRLVNLHCPDEMSHIVKSLEMARDLGAEWIVVSGGLGPTEDDVTRQAVAHFAGLELEWREDAWDHVKRFFARRAVVDIPQSNRRQAFLPRGAQLLDNPWGTACAFSVSVAAGRAGPKGQTEVSILCLPGVPYEFEGVLQRWCQALPESQAGRHPAAQGDAWLLSGLGESAFEDTLMSALPSGSLREYAICARAGLLEVKIAWSSDDSAAALRDLFWQHFGSFIVGQGLMPLAQRVVSELASSGALFVADCGATSGLMTWQLAEAELQQHGAASSRVGGALFARPETLSPRTARFWGAGLLGSSDAWGHLLILTPGPVSAGAAADAEAQHVPSFNGIRGTCTLLTKVDLRARVEALKHKRWFRGDFVHESPDADERAMLRGCSSRVSWPYAVASIESLDGARGGMAVPSARTEPLRRIATAALVGVYALLGPGDVLTCANPQGS